MTFEEWIKDPETIKTFNEVKAAAQERVEAGKFDVAGHIETLFDVSGPAAELLDMAKEYHNEKVLAFLNGKRVEECKKTELDRARKWPCAELRMVERMEDLQSLIELRISALQSLAKCYNK